MRNVVRPLESGTAAVGSTNDFRRQQFDNSLASPRALRIQDLTPTHHVARNARGVESG